MFPIESREVYPDTTENFIVCIKCGYLTDTKYKHECPGYKLVFNSPITSAFAWGLDFWTAFKLRPKVVRWLVRLLIGKYAWSELIGLKMHIEEIGYQIWDSYNLENCNYHKINLDYKDW